MIMLTFRHGLRAAEIYDLRCEQVDFRTAALHVRRVKSGTPATHPLTGREMRALRRQRRESHSSPRSMRVGTRRTADRARISRMVERTAVAAGLGLKALRHACGYNHG
jgi:integrase